VQESKPNRARQNRVIPRSVNPEQTLMKKIYLIAVLVVSSLASTHAGCYQEDIDTVSNDGEIIVLLDAAEHPLSVPADGSAWESLDPATSATWLSAETVLVCNDRKMINKDENGESVDVVQVR